MRLQNYSMFLPLQFLHYYLSSSISLGAAIHGSPISMEKIDLQNKYSCARDTNPVVGQSAGILIISTLVFPLSTKNADGFVT